MKLPKRTVQKSAEAESLAIVNYKLGDLGIFRNQTDNDYGIDLDLEIVSGQNVTARGVKIQVKAGRTLTVLKDGSRSVGGVKQSTLRYWCDLSFRTNVIAYAIDLASENIYVSDNLFWQAASKIDGTYSTKSIKFVGDDEYNVEFCKGFTILEAFKPTVSEFIAAHTLALRRIENFLSLLADAFHYDDGTEIEDTDFRELLDVCSILLWHTGDGIWKDENDKRYWKNYSYWRRKSEADGWDGISCYSARPILVKLLPALIGVLRRYREKAISSKFYLSHVKPDYLALVYETTIPDCDDKDGLIKASYDYSRRMRLTGGGAYFVYCARAQVANSTGSRKSGKR